MRYQVLNGYGNGTVHVYTDITCADKAELKERYMVDRWELKGVTHGKTYIYPYDGFYNHDTGDLAPEDPIATLHGRYAIWAGTGLGLTCGIVIFERWA